MPRLFNFRDFEFVHGIFTLPEDIYMFRATHPDRPLPPGHPAFFGDYEVASFYAQEPGRILRAYTPRAGLRVMDIRYLRGFLPELWSDVSKNAEDREIISMTSLVLGMMSFGKQIELLKELQIEQMEPMIARMERFQSLPEKPSWANPVELRGVRCGLTDIDYFVTAFFKQLLGHLIDGIIAPAMPTPFHDQLSEDISKSGMYQELILFSPDLVLQEVTASNQRLPVTGTIECKKYVRDFMRVLTPQTRVSRMSLNQVGGRARYVPPRDEVAERLSDDMVLQRKYVRFRLRACQFAKKLKNVQTYLRYYCPNICTLGVPMMSDVSIGSISL